jgi:hypothetical protein
MKQKDLLMVLLLVVIFLPFFIFDPLYQLYSGSNAAHPYIWSFIKFAVLATIGECIGLRIRTGNYYTKGFGILPRAFVWGILGLMIKAAFVIFAAGAPMMLASLGVKFPAELPNPGAILSQSIFVSHSWLQVLAAFTFSATMNVFFAPMFMTLHKITDAHIGETGGSETVTLLQSEIPSHSHQAKATAAPGTSTNPTDGIWAVAGSRRAPTSLYSTTAAAGTTMSAQALAPAGGSLPHNNMPPYLTMNFIIALQGVFPPRT